MRGLQHRRASASRCESGAEEPRDRRRPGCARPSPPPCAPCATPTGTWPTRIASLAVQRQSLELAQESLRNTRARVEIGTTPPIDIVEAESEVAQREEAVIVAEAQIQTAEDTLRALIFDPSSPDFWTMRIEAADAAAVPADAVDVDGAVRNALDKRTDLQQPAKSLEVERRQHPLPAEPDAAGRDRAVRLRPVGPRRHAASVAASGRSVPAPATSSGRRSAASAPCSATCSANRFPSWTASLNVSYPIGTSQPEANLARARLQYSQAQTQLKNQQLQVTTQVREAARQVQTNQKRVETHARVALARRTAARGRAAQVRRRHVHQLPRVPGAARPGAWPATTSCARSSTTTSRSSTSRRCRKMPLGGGAP